MTKEELKKEAEEYAKENNIVICCDCNYYESEEDLLDAYLAGAEPREKRIAELERKLEQTEKDLTDYQFNYPKIKDLEKENAELKEHHKSVCETLTNTHRSLREQLTKAKEIIRHLLLLPYANNEEVFADVTSILNKAEQFIKDSEVEK